MDAPTSPALDRAGVTITITALRGASTAAVRQEAERAVQVNHGTLLASSPDEIRAAYGTPRPSRDHALRAIRGACDQVDFLRSTNVQLAFGVAVGSPIDGTTDSPEATLLAGLAPVGAVLINEPALHAVLGQLPANWEFAQLLDAERLQTHQPVPPRELQDQLAPNLELIVLQALRHRPAERYASVGEFLADLERFTRGDAVHAQPPSLRARAAAVASAFRRRFS